MSDASTEEVGYKVTDDESLVREHDSYHALRNEINSRLELPNWSAVQKHCETLGKGPGMTLQVASYYLVAAFKRDSITGLAVGIETLFAALAVQPERSAKGLALVRWAMSNIQHEIKTLEATKETQREFYRIDRACKALLAEQNIDGRDHVPKLYKFDRIVSEQIELLENPPSPPEEPPVEEQDGEQERPSESTKETQQSESEPVSTVQPKPASPPPEESSTPPKSEEPNKTLYGSWREVLLVLIVVAVICIPLFWSQLTQQPEIHDEGLASLSPPPPPAAASTPIPAVSTTPEPTVAPPLTPVQEVVSLDEAKVLGADELSSLSPILNNESAIEEKSRVLIMYSRKITSLLDRKAGDNLLYAKELAETLQQLIPDSNLALAHKVEIEARLSSHSAELDSQFRRFASARRATANLSRALSRSSGNKGTTPSMKQSGSRLEGYAVSLSPMLARISFIEKSMKNNDFTRAEREINTLNRQLVGLAIKSYRLEKALADHQQLALNSVKKE